MQCKNYRAYTMAEAMAAVKADLGNDAIVLHTRTLTQGGFLGLGRKTVIEITAARPEGSRTTPSSHSSASQRAAGAATSQAIGNVMVQGAAARAYDAAARGNSEVEIPERNRLAATEDIHREATQFDRDRTRLLAQAMAEKLERERAELPRTGAPSAASANAAATAAAVTRQRQPSVPAAAPTNGDAKVSAATAFAGGATQPPLAQRFVLIPANDAARAVERQALLQRVGPAAPTAAPNAAPAAEPRNGPVANRPLSVAPDSASQVAPPPPAPKAPQAAPTVTVETFEPRISFAVAPTPMPRVPVTFDDELESHVSPEAPRVERPRLSVERPAAAPVAGIDLAAIDRLVEEVLRRPAESTRASAAQRGGSSRPERLESLYANLLSQDIGNDLADAIVTDLHASLTPEELASDHAVRSAAMQRIAALLPPCTASGSLEPDEAGGWRREGRPLTVAFIGPTGVGKTTTVAKIAASLKLRYGARVGLVTCDTYRIAAVDQLRTYAEIIGLPLEIVLSPGQMRQSRQRLNELDVILIDTAGRSQNDADRLGELAAMVKAAEPHETHLVLSSTAHEKVLMREAQAFSTVGVDRIVLTKLDEAVGLGAVLRVLRQVGRGVSYLTTGQEVPQHIEAARPARLAELVLGGAPNA